MNIQTGAFTSFDRFKEVIKDWALDFTILSKGDFTAEFSLLTSQTLLLGREKLNGKIEHKGTSPIGYRTLIIPVSKEVEFVWFNKKVNGEELQIFPKNNEIDVVTFDGLDIHLISIEETVLFDVIDTNGFTNCRKIFDTEVREVYLTKEFSAHFFNAANKILNPSNSSTEKHNTNVTNIIFSVVEYLENCEIKDHLVSHKKKYVALLKAVDIIKNEKDISYSIPQLCNRVNVSVRTLYDAFMEKYQVSTGDFIKAVRLNQTREEIYHSCDVSISEIAGRYHFWHMGQFAKDFKKQFGVLPSEIRNKK